MRRNSEVTKNFDVCRWGATSKFGLIVLCSRKCPVNIVNARVFQDGDLLCGGGDGDLQDVLCLPLLREMMKFDDYTVARHPNTS